MVCVAFLINRIIAPSNPNPEKLTSYECGEETTGNSWLPFNSRFYVIALIFLLFDVEMVFIFPWAVVFGNHEINHIDARWGWLALTEMFTFLGILILGLVYVWVKGDLDWIKPEVHIPLTDITIPAEIYERLNAKQSSYKVKPFTMAAEPALAEAEAATQPGSPTPIRKPMFKPTFKKPGNE